MYRTAAGAGGGEEQLTRDGANKGYMSVAPDGNGLLFAEQRAAMGWDLIYLSLETPHERRPLLATALSEWSPALSRDGRWLAYVSHPIGGAPFQVFVRPAEETGAGVPVSPAGCWWPRWARSGRELFFRCADKLESVVVGQGANLPLSKPRVLFEGAFRDEFDVAPDGRFVMVKRSAREGEPAQIIYVPNWVDEMRAVYDAAVKG